MNLVLSVHIVAPDWTRAANNRLPLLCAVCLEEEEEEAVAPDMQRAYDWLEADDPALFSDEFSGPEEWDLPH